MVPRKNWALISFLNRKWAPLHMLCSMTAYKEAEQIINLLLKIRCFFLQKWGFFLQKICCLYLMTIVKLLCKEI